MPSRRRQRQGAPPVQTARRDSPRDRRSPRFPAASARGGRARGRDGSGRHRVRGSNWIGPGCNRARARDRRAASLREKSAPAGPGEKFREAGAARTRAGPRKSAPREFDEGAPFPRRRRKCPLLFLFFRPPRRPLFFPFTLARGNLRFGGSSRGPDPPPHDRAASRDFIDSSADL